MSKGRLGEDNDKEISQEERIKSLIEIRLSEIPEKKEFTKRELAELILKEMDFAFEYMDSVEFQED